VIVDYGVSAYTGPERQFCRSWEGHNSLSVDHQDCCEVVGNYMVGKWTIPREVTFDSDQPSGSISASHGGFMHLDGKPIHRRHIRWTNDPVAFIIHDTVDGEGTHTITRQLRFAAPVKQLDVNVLQVRLATGVLQLKSSSEWSLTESQWWPSPGVSLPAILAQLNERTTIPWDGLIECTWDPQSDSAG
jgi:hypothetical protein